MTYRRSLAMLLVILTVAALAAVAAFQVATHQDNGLRSLHAKLLTDPQPGHGKDCPYPPPGHYGKVAPGRDKHCNSPKP